MAALQGKGGFGAPPPVAPKPHIEKPKWKPPPVVSPPADDDDDDRFDQAAATAAEPHPRSPPPRRFSVQSDKNEKHNEEVATRNEGDQEGDQPGEADPEEEERQRRAAIAARLARLGGTRVGMAPVFGKPPPPPPARKPSLPPVHKVEEKSEPTAEPTPQALSEEPKAAAEVERAAEGTTFLFSYTQSYSETTA